MVTVLPGKFFKRQKPAGHKEKPSPPPVVIRSPRELSTSPKKRTRVLRRCVKAHPRYSGLPFFAIDRQAFF